MNRSCGKPYRAAGTCQGATHGSYNLSWRIEDGSGKVCPNANAVFREAGDVCRDDLLRGLDFSGAREKQSGCYGLVCSRQAKSKHQWLGQMMRTDPGQLLTTHGEFVKRGDPAWRLWRRKTGRKAFTGCALCYYRRGMKVTIENKKEVKVRGQELHPLNKGKPCPKGVPAESTRLAQAAR